MKDSRRKLLKTLTATGAAATVIPAVWSKPLVESVILPAHAQTTTFDELRFQGAVGIGNASLLESVIGTAHAATDFTGSCVHFTIENLVGGKGYIQVEIATSGKLIGDPNGNVVDDAFFFNFNGGDWISGELIRDDSGAVIRVDGKVNDEDYSGFPAGSSGCGVTAAPTTWYYDRSELVGLLDGLIAPAYANGSPIITKARLSASGIFEMQLDGVDVTGVSDPTSLLEGIIGTAHATDPMVNCHRSAEALSSPGLIQLNQVGCGDSFFKATTTGVPGEIIIQYSNGTDFETINMQPGDVVLDCQGCLV